MDLRALLGSLADGRDTAFRAGKAEFGRQMDDRAQATGGTNLVGLMIGVMIAAIVVIQVFIPVVNDAIASAELTGTTETIVELLPLFAALLILIALAAPLMRRL